MAFYKKGFRRQGIHFPQPDVQLLNITKNANDIKLDTKSTSDKTTPNINNNNKNSLETTAFSSNEEKEIRDIITKENNIPQKNFVKTQVSCNSDKNLTQTECDVEIQNVTMKLENNDVDCNDIVREGSGVNIFFVQENKDIKREALVDYVIEDVNGKKADSIGPIIDTGRITLNAVDKVASDIQVDKKPNKQVAESNIRIKDHMPENKVHAEQNVPQQDTRKHLQKSTTESAYSNFKLSPYSRHKRKNKRQSSFSSLEQYVTANKSNDSLSMTIPKPNYFSYKNPVPSYYGSTKDVLHLNRRISAPAYTSIVSFSVALTTDVNHNYKPTEDVCGSTTLEFIRHESCSVEFSVVGYGMLKSTNPITNKTIRKKEYYIHKTINLYEQNKLTTRKAVYFEPGNYNCRFSFTLPANLPSSINYIDRRGTLAFQITYYIEVSITSNLTNNRQKHSKERKGLTHKHVLLKRKLKFNVLREFSIDLIPNSMWPNKICDEVTFGCYPFGYKHFEAIAIVKQGVYVCGDVIDIEVEIKPEYKKQVQHITMELRQTIGIQQSRDMVVGLINSSRYDRDNWSEAPCRRIADHMDLKLIYTDHIPTPEDMLPSDLTGSSLILVSYKIYIYIALKSNNKKLQMELPVIFGPSGLIKYPWERKVDKWPMFNCTTRYPNFGRLSNVSATSSLKSITTNKSLSEYDLISIEEKDDRGSVKINVTFKDEENK